MVSKVSTLETEILREKTIARKRAAKGPPREDRAQIEFIEWARKHCELVWHTPNARKYSRRSWAYWKAMGVEPGMPDVMLICQGTHIALEFKRTKNDKPSVRQKAVLGMLHNRGWKVAVVSSCPEAVRFVRENAGVRDE